MFDGKTISPREVLTLATLARESGDAAAERAKECALKGDVEGQHFHTGRQAAFLTMLRAAHELAREGAEIQHIKSVDDQLADLGAS